MDRRTFLLSSMAGGAAIATGYWAVRGVREYPTAHAVSSGPLNHFFGYYDKCPWDTSGQFLLGSQIGFYERNPTKGESLTVGYIDLAENNRLIPLDTTQAWSWQQGTMLQWLGESSEVIYNTTEGNRYVATVRNISTGQTRHLPRPIYAVSRDGRQAVTLDFERVNRLRPGYGYIALPEQDADDHAPKAKGIYWMDLRTGANKLILSLDWAANNLVDNRFAGAEHWFNALQFNPSGTRFIFLHRWRQPNQRSWFTRTYTAKPDGTEVRLLSDVNVFSHFDWRDDQTILAWTRTNDFGDHYYLIDDLTAHHSVFGGGILTQDGHCSYSPDREWILTDTYPGKDHEQTLMLYHIKKSKRIDIGHFKETPKIIGTPFRCDLHPRWNRDGTKVCIDSTHSGARQIYVINVGDIIV